MKKYLEYVLIFFSLNTGELSVVYYILKILILSVDSYPLPTFQLVFFSSLPWFVSTIFICILFFPFILLFSVWGYLSFSNSGKKAGLITFNISINLISWFSFPLTVLIKLDYHPSSVLNMVLMSYGHITGHFIKAKRSSYW